MEDMLVQPIADEDYFGESDFGSQDFDVESYVFDTHLIALEEDVVLEIIFFTCGHITQRVHDLKLFFDQESTDEDLPF